MELKDLRSGMVVELGNKSLYMVIRGMDNYPNGVITSLSGCAWINLSNYSHTMRSNNYRFEDIVRVYDVPFTCMDKLMAKIKDAQPIWAGNLIRWGRVENNAKILVLEPYSGDRLPRFFAKYADDFNTIYYCLNGVTSWSWDGKELACCPSDDVTLVEEDEQ